jgi:protein TonB
VATSGAGGRTSGGPATGPDALTVIPFGEGMTRPSLLSKIDPTYTRDALAAKVQGLMLVKCVITTRGNLESCRVVKGLPHMDSAVLSALAQWRYSPVLFQGKAVNVDYVIPVRLVLP